MTFKPAPARDVMVAHLDGEAVLLDLASKRYFRLNATGAAIWKEIEAGRDRDEIADALVDRFDVDRETANQAIADLIGELTQRGLLDAGGQND